MYISNLKNTIGSALSYVDHKMVDGLSEIGKKIKTLAIIAFCCIAAVYLFALCCTKKKNVKKIDADEKENLPENLELDSNLIPEPNALIPEPNALTEQQKAPGKLAEDVHYDKQKSITDNLEKGNAFLDQEKYAEAEIAFKEVLDVDYSNSSAKKGYDRALFEQGSALRKQGKFAEAAEKFKEALKEDLFNVNKLIPYGETLLELGQYEAAIAQFARVTLSDSKDEFPGAQGFANKGVALALVKQGRHMDATIHFVAAEGNFIKALKENLTDASLAKGYWETLCAYGKSLFVQKYYNFAGDRFKRALEINPKDLEILKCYAQTLYFHQAGVQEVVTVFGRALDILTQDPELIKLYKDALLQYAKTSNINLVNFIDKAKHFKNAKETFPEDLQLLENYRFAFVDCKKDFEIFSDNCFSQQQFVDAVNLCEAALEIYPKWAYALSLCGIAFYRLKKYEEAILKFKEHFTIQPEGIVLVYYAAALAALGKIEDARAQLTVAFGLGDIRFKENVKVYLNKLNTDGKFEV